MCQTGARVDYRLRLITLLSPVVNFFQVDAYTDTHKHLLTLTAGSTHYSKLLRENFTADSAHSISEALVYYNVSSPATTTTKCSTTAFSGKTTKAPYSWSKFSYSGMKDLFSKPLTLKAIDRMVLVHRCHVKYWVP